MNRLHGILVHESLILKERYLCYITSIIPDRILLRCREKTLDTNASITATPCLYIIVKVLQLIPKSQAFSDLGFVFLSKVINSLYLVSKDKVFVFCRIPILRLVSIREKKISTGNTFYFVKAVKKTHLR